MSELNTNESSKKPKLSSKQIKLGIGALVAVVIVIVGVILVPKLFGNTIDLTDGVEVKFSGYSGKGKVASITLDKSKFEDAKLRSFMNLVYYKSDVNGSVLKNGDEIEIKATYSETLRKKYGFNVKGETKKIKVEGLSELIEKKGDYTDDVKKELEAKAKVQIDERVEKMKSRVKDPEVEPKGVKLVKGEHDTTIEFYYNVKGKVVEKSVIYGEDEVLEHLVVVYFKNPTKPVSDELKGYSEEKSLTYKKGSTIDDLIKSYEESLTKRGKEIIEL